jgi:type I restriction enzyme S subunit
MTETIPKSWELKKISEFAYTKSGGTPSTAKKEYWEGGEIPWLPSGKCQNCIIDTAEKFITEEGLKNSSAVLFPKNSILIALTGATTGKIGYLTFESSGNQSITSIQPNDKYVSKYLYYYLQKIYKHIITKNVGAAQPHINKAIVDEFKILLPPLPEQEKIADILSKVDEQIKLTEENITQTEELKKGLMVDSLSDNNFSNLRTISEITKTGAGGTPSRSNKDFYIGKIPWLKSGELNDNKSITDSSEHISEDAIQKSSAKIFPKNTILMAMYGATVGKMGIIRIEASTNQAVCGIYPDESFDLDFLYYALYMKKEELIKQGKGGAQPNISQEIIRNTRLPFPSKAEQIKIGKAMSSIDEHLVHLDEEKEKLKQLKKGLMQDLLSGKVRVKV